MNQTKRCIRFVTGLIFCLAVHTAAFGDVPVRVLTYNIHHGRGLDEKLDLARIARVITEAKADLVLLQEVDHKAARSGSVDQVAELSRLTGLHGHFSRAIDLQGGEYGLAVLSRFPLSEGTIHKLPGTARSEARIAAEHAIEIQGQKIIVVTLHLDHADAALRFKQAQQVRNIFEAKSPAVILGGDFNAVPESDEMTQYLANWEGVDMLKAGTHPANQPRVQIDYLLTRKNGPLTIQEQTVVAETVASDHCPVLSIFVLKAN